MEAASFDIVVIGGGPGGYVAAIRAAQLGLTCAVVEREHLGGICLNWGCIPTKALLRASELKHLLGELDAFGLSVEGVHVDTRKMVARSRAVAAQLSSGVAYLLNKNKVDVVRGTGRLGARDAAGLRVVEVADGNGKTSAIKARHVILATGARARSLPGIEPDGRLVWTYKEAMVPEAIPKSLLVIGSGAIGIEFASFYRDMGADVTVVEILDRILPAEDEEISKLARAAFESQGMRIVTGATVTALAKNKDSVTARIEKGKERTEVTAERAILAVGIVGNTEGLGLEGTKVRVEKTHVVVNQWLETGEPGVSAIGDLVGPPWLAHKASHEGVVCVERIAGVKGVHPLDVTRVPACTYSRPQIASIGLSEAAAKAAGRAVKVGRFPYRANGKALALGEPDGLIKVVFDAATGELLGAHMIGAEVTELIQGFAIARTLEATEAELIETIFPHPTLSETMHEAVLDAWGRAIHF
ncbi:MAG: dihydrolipoyl dehydrogenase [Alphaproteobacteria bacterium]